MTLRVMQVLHQGGGAGSVTSTLHLSLGLQRAGVQVRFVCPPDSEVEAAARAAGLEVHPLRLLPRARLANAAALAEWLARHPVDLVNSQSARDREALTWLALTRRLPVPFVATRRQMPRTFWLENWLAGRYAARVIAVSRPVAEALVRRGTPKEKIRVVHNGLVAARVDRVLAAGEVERWRRRIGWEPSRATLGIVSRLKDQGVVLRALAQVAAPVRLVLAGVAPGGPLERLAARVPPRHAVVFLPFEPDVRPLYELLDLVLLPSRMEGLSQALLEAMALAKPVIASAHSGNLDLIRDGVDGRLVPPTDPAAWARAIEELLAESARARRLGEAARTTARETFSLERTVRGTLAVYQEVMRGNVAGPIPS
ncbi:MAG TPA: glycosyltransferase family 4 protein [Gemmatimonadales bacterium]|nr:glycosyltransferase family 4 protein [Gemmatimonadales bacterium]